MPDRCCRRRPVDSFVSQLFVGSVELVHELAVRLSGSVELLAALSESAPQPVDLCLEGRICSCRAAWSRGAPSPDRA